MVEIVQVFNGSYCLNQCGVMAMNSSIDRQVFALPTKALFMPYDISALGHPFPDVSA
jgi:hypothetical protein